jgi:zinc transport system substrate-binding protein
MKNWSSRVLLLSLILSIVASLAIAASCTQPEETTDKIGVVVTIVPQAEFVEKVGGDKVNVTIMVPPGASPHTYEPTPSQMTALSKAVLYAKVGSGVEFELTWMDKLIAQNEDMLVVDCSQGVQLREVVTVDEHEHEAAEDEHEHGAMDPHIWMSPVNAQIMVRNIADGLIQVDPDNRDYYEQNRDAYLQELARLDEDIAQGLSGAQNRVFMVYHPAFGYLAGEYDLTMLPIESGGDEPTAADLQYVIDQATELGIRAVFASPQFNTQSAEVIADAIDGCVVLTDPLAKDYIENLRTIADELVRVME